jgi:GcrA cell cycle regulator
MRTKNSMKWTPEQEAQLRQLWEVDGLSSGDIAWTFGVTRNSIIGKVHRLGLAQRAGRKVQPRLMPKAVRMSPPRRPKRERSFAPLPLLSESLPGDTTVLYGLPWEALPGTTPVPLVDLEPSMCRWPIGEAKPFLFCAAQIEVGTHYCTAHNDMAIGRGSSLERAAMRIASAIGRAELREQQRAKESAYA